MPKYEFQCVNEFLRTEIDARAIKSAMELGVLDALNAPEPVPLATLAGECGLHPVGTRFLIDLLERNAVVARKGDAAELTPLFRTALRYRDLLECRLAFADLVWPDIHALFTPLMTDPQQFMARSTVFDLFRYDRCVEITPATLAATAAWTRFTTCLTKYEAPVLLDAIDLASVRSFADFGGNTGELALQVCERNLDVTATVIDLPAVCSLGEKHVASAGTAAKSRVRFFPCDMRRDALPPPADLVTFKSVLHDWPEADAGQLLERARGVVRPGGRLVIFERGPIDLARQRIPYALTPDLVFLHFLRPAELYLRTLAQLGFEVLEHRRVALDLGFHFIVARRPA